MCGGAEGPAWLRLHSVWREDQAGSKRPPRSAIHSFGRLLHYHVTTRLVLTMTLLTGGAAVKAGVQEGDRIIKVIFAPT